MPTRNPERYNVVDVDNDATIAELASTKGINIPQGGAFYSLTRTESISAKKKIVAVNSTDGTILVDDDARRELNIALTGTVKLKPSDLPNGGADWTCYVQSTSSNRKLKAGWKLLYLDYTKPEFVTSSSCNGSGTTTTTTSTSTTSSANTMHLPLLSNVDATGPAVPQAFAGVNDHPQNTSTSTNLVDPGNRSDSHDKCIASEQITIGPRRIVNSHPMEVVQEMMGEDDLAEVFFTHKQHLASLTGPLDMAERAALRAMRVIQEDIEIDCYTWDVFAHDDNVSEAHLGYHEISDLRTGEKYLALIMDGSMVCVPNAQIVVISRKAPYHLIGTGSYWETDATVKWEAQTDEDMPLLRRVARATQLYRMNGLVYDVVYYDPVLNRSLATVDDDVAVDEKISLSVNPLKGYNGYSKDEDDMYMSGGGDNDDEDDDDDDDGGGGGGGTDIVPGVVVKVTKSSTGKEICQREGHDFVRGCVFYQLMKTENISGSKEVVVRDGTGRFLFGNEARKSVGLPEDGKTAVKKNPKPPRGKGLCVIFIQSTSPNRKIPAGSEVFIRAPADEGELGSGGGGGGGGGKKRKR